MDRVDEKVQKAIELADAFWKGCDEGLFSEGTLAAVLDQSVAWCQRARVYGGGPRFLKLGRSVRYRKRDVVEWIDSHRAVSNTTEYETKAA